MGALSFLTPWFLAGAVAVAVPFVLHMLRREQTPALAFTAVRFLRQAPREQQRRRELRDIWLLLLRMLALIVLAISFARPYIKSGEATAGGITVVALDTSFSMSGKEQFERARKAALSLVSSTPAGDRVAAMAFDDRAALVSPPALERGSARAAFNALKASAGATNYAGLLASSARVFGQAGGKLIVVTDLQRSGWTTEGVLPANVQLQVVDVAGPLDNVAVESLKRDANVATAVVSNYGARARSVRVALTVDERPAGLSVINLEPGASETVRFADAVLPSKGVAKVSVDDRLGLAADNERYLVLEAPPPPSVLLLTQREDGEDAFYLREAVQAVDGPRAFAVDLVKASERNSLQPGRFKTHPVVWLLGTRGLDRRIREQIATYVQEGGALLVTAGPMLDPSSFASLFEQAGKLKVESAEGTGFPTTLAPVDTRHPIFAAFGTFAANLGQAEFTQALRIAPPADGNSRIVARFTNGLPAMVEQEIGSGRVIVFASDVSSEWNDFPRQPTFVPFVNETLRYLANLRERPRDLTVGAVVAGLGAAGVAGLQAGDIGATSKPGVIKIGSPERLVAVNVDARESRPARMTDTEFTQMVRRTDAEGRSADIVAREQESGQHWWRYGLLALMAVLVAEGLLARRPAPVSVSSGPATAGAVTSAP
jgi:Mg-chelatase subunit ChlD